MSLKQCISNALSITSGIYCRRLPSKENVGHYLKPLYNPTYQSMHRHFSLQTIRHISHTPLKPTRRGKGPRPRPRARYPASRPTVVTQPSNIHYPLCRYFTWWVVFHHKSPACFCVPALENVHHLSTHVEPVCQRINQINQIN